MFNTSDGFDLYNNEWNSSANPGPQKICGKSRPDWQVTSTQRAKNTEVLTYPSVQKNYPNRALSSFTSVTSSYAENMNATAGTDAEAAYDIWINDLNSAGSRRRAARRSSPPERSASVAHGLQVARE